MRHVVVGAGAIGAGVAALLHEAGLPVALVARGDTLAAVREHGVRLTVGHDERFVPVPVVGSLADLDWTPPDAVVHLAVKSHQTEAIVPDLVAHVPDRVPVVCLQNGVSNERLLLRHRPLVHGCVVMMPASSLAPGEVLLHSLNRPGLFDVGRFPAGADADDDALATDLRHAGFDVVVRPEVMAWKHRKLLMNLGNAVDAACLDSPDADRLTDILRAEGQEILERRGVAVVGQDADRDRRGDLLRPLVRRDEAGSSTWQSLARGTGSTEVDHLNGEIVLQARLGGFEAPANALLQNTVVELARAGGAPRSLDAASLLAQL
ncbi:ketopantoate reductase family protein [Nocardioides acrostichi]|uniref:Ketopantoate reductase family protein n=1 Tax=Nocardioides acrostichi TaxID=2784339 RepID=A0A930UY02_9ACTN|nr:2-dehydropantoate 2-reductase N-terminal domain-containing protein [Nocardioides acrostichi]MBF4162958.1 ketopantoate reductase family protein [Nocardioides acrostichi]